LDPSTFLDHWYYQLPNYALALMQYAAIGWLILGLFVDENWSNYIFRGFVSHVSLGDDPAVGPSWFRVNGASDRIEGTVPKS
jgi:hypothetical protein